MISCVLKDNRRLSHAFETTPFLKYFKHGLLLKIYNNRDHNLRNWTAWAVPPRSSSLGTFNQEKETSQATRSKEKRLFSQAIETNIENKSEITGRKFVFVKCPKKITLGFHQKWNQQSFKPGKDFPLSMYFSFITVIFQKTTYSVCWRCMSTYVFR